MVTECYCPIERVSLDNGFAMTSSSRKIVKILVLGPCKAGKSAISTFLGEVADWEACPEYRPTKGVRIVEFECSDVSYGENKMEIDVELWDCSGDMKYRNCWGALQEDVQGVMMVANPDENSAEDLEIWFSEFVQKAGLQPDHVMIVLNEKGEKSTNSGSISEFRVLPGLSQAEFVGCNLRHEGEQLRSKFGDFLQRIVVEGIDSWGDVLSKEPGRNQINV